jgi:hypothetical protein
MAQYIPDVRFIASIYPGVLPTIRRHYGPSRQSEGVGAQRSTAFTLQPVARGKKPFVLPLYDSFENVLDIVSLSSMGNKAEKPRLPKPVPVETIVADLLKEWTGGLFNVPQGAMPGVIEIRPMKVELEKWEKSGTLPGATVSELDQMETQQTLYFEYLFTEGERLHKQNNWKEITDTMRTAAEWLGHEREWSHRAIARDSGPCPWCQAIVPNIAIVCNTCGRQVRETPPHLAHLEKPSAALRP